MRDVDKDTALSFKNQSRDFASVMKKLQVGKGY